MTSSRRAAELRGGELTIAAVLVAPERDSLVSTEVPELTMDFGGVVGDRHYGATARSNSRHARFYPRGTVIRNRRQVSLVSVEELREVARRMDLPEIRPEHLGANVLVSGVADFSALPIGTRLLFPSRLCLVCEGVNQPCRLPAQVLHEQYPDSGALTRFGRGAYGRRGIVASIEHPGVLRAGERARVFLPELHAITSPATPDVPKTQH